MSSPQEVLESRAAIYIESFIRNLQKKLFNVEVFLRGLRPKFAVRVPQTSLIYFSLQKEQKEQKWVLWGGGGPIPRENSEYPKTTTGPLGIFYEE